MGRSSPGPGLARPASLWDPEPIHPRSALPGPQTQSKRLELSDFWFLLALVPSAVLLEAFKTAGQSREGDG